jgi:RNA polymerase sigma-70 factor (ECF subfamily)
VNDTELIGRILAGDPGAERELYEAHVDRVYRLAYRLAGEPDRAEDYTQETFIRVFDRLHTFQYRSSLSTWIVSVGLSVTLNGLRKTKRLRNRELPLDDAPEIGGNGHGAEPDLKARLTRAIDDLPDGYRTVFVMHDVEGYTHEEIGAALGVQSGTSKAQLFRARARLRTALADFIKE